MLVTLHLEKLQFFAYHGMYEEEKKLGNEFELNIKASFHSDQTVIAELDQTINYATLYELAKTEMQQPRELLETFLSELAAQIKERFPQVVQLSMSLYKLQMPLTHFQGRIGVELECRF